MKNTHRIGTYQRAEQLVGGDWIEVIGLYGKEVAEVLEGPKMGNGAFEYATVYEGTNLYRLFEVKLEKL